jgi:hypothetical protein
MALPVSNKTNYGLGVACVVFLIIAGWYASSVMGDLSSYNDWDKPAQMAKMIKGCVYGGIGFLLALGVNFLDIVRPVLVFVPALSRYAKVEPEQADPPSVST